MCKQSNHLGNWEGKEYTVNPVQKEDYTLDVDVTCKPGDSVISFVVQMKNKAGLSEPSNTIELSVDDMIPGPPEKIKALVSAREITLTWDPPGCNAQSARAYNIKYQKAQKAVASWNPVISDYQGDRTFTIDKLSPKTSYIICIEAKSKHCVSLSKKITCETKSAKPNRPEKPLIKVLSATKAELQVTRPTEEDANGEAITHVIIKVASKMSRSESASIQWTSEENEFKMDEIGGPIKFEVSLRSFKEEMSLMYLICFKKFHWRR